MKFRAYKPNRGNFPQWQVTKMLKTCMQPIKDEFCNQFHIKEEGETISSIT